MTSSLNPVPFSEPCSGGNPFFPNSENWTMTSLHGKNNQCFLSQKVINWGNKLGLAVWISHCFLSIERGGSCRKILLLLVPSVAQMYSCFWGWLVIVPLIFSFRIYADGFYMLLSVGAWEETPSTLPCFSWLFPQYSISYMIKLLLRSFFDS